MSVKKKPCQVKHMTLYFKVVQTVYIYAVSAWKTQTTELMFIYLTIM